MQVIPATAGRDVYVRVKGKNGQPTREDLFNPAYNIDVGTAYLHLLQTVYLADIQDPQSRRYAVISAYNGGAGGCSTPSSNRKAAPDMINRLSPRRSPSGADRAASQGGGAPLPLQGQPGREGSSEPSPVGLADDVQRGR